MKIETSRIVAGLPIYEVANRLEKAAEVESDILTFLADWQQWLRTNRHLHERHE